MGGFIRNFGDINVPNKTSKFWPVSKTLIASVFQNWHKIHFLLQFLFPVSVLIGKGGRLTNRVMELGVKEKILRKFYTFKF